jgi:hypothetical protein
VIHWPPHLADRFTSIVAKGDKVKATGWMETGLMGDTHLEIQALVNLRTDASAQNDAGPGGPTLVAPRGAENGARRLRELEDQLEQIRREIERLRRDN